MHIDEIAGASDMRRWGGLEYRLSDLVSGYLQRLGVNVTGIFCSLWPASIGCSYARAATRLRDMDAFLAVLQQQALQRKDLWPAPSALVVHLRLGDVLDWNRHKLCWAQLEAGRECQYVHAVTTYANFRVPPAVDHAILVGCPMYRAKQLRHRGNRSLNYVADVHRVIQRKLPVKSFRLDATADDDLVFLSRARYLLPGRGGFGSLAALAVRAANGTVVTLR